MEQASHNQTEPAQAQYPERYPRRVLLCVTGLSPQVVTETLYALATENKQRFVPTEIHLVTTAEGSSRARLMLLDSEDGRFFQFCEEYGLEADSITFADETIHVIEGPEGALPDITSEEDNTAVANAITDQVRRLTADRNCALHASIAGGRKTMGFYLGYAMSLFGRTQDRLSHVLVSQPFESDHQFYYPPKKPKRLIIKDHPVHTSEARVMLADIPFVRLRHGLDDRLTKGQASFSEVVASAQAALGPPELVIDLAGRRIRAGGTEVKLPPSSLALFSSFARCALTGTAPLSAPPKEVPDQAWAARYLAEYRAIHKEADDTDETERALCDGMDGEYFSTHLSKLRKRLKKALGAAAAPYLIDDGGTRPRRYQLALTPESIRFGSWED